MFTMLRNIHGWLLSLAQVIRREFTLIIGDPGVLLFFIGLPLMYPIVYTLIYNPELVRDLPVVVVDQCGTAGSRDFTRHLDACEAVDVIAYEPTLDAARHRMNLKGCYGIMVIPGDYSQRLGRGEQAVVSFYSDMSLLLRYRSFLSALTDLQLATGAEIRHERISSLGAATLMPQDSPVANEAFFIGDTTQGFASYIIPGIIILILQQSMLLGAAMIMGGHNERRRRHGGTDPLAAHSPASATAIGKMLTYVIIYLPLSLYVLHYIPLMFSLPHIGSLMQVISLVTPMLIATAMLGITIGHFLSERESVFPVLVVTSVTFLFLSGITWPRYAMGPVISTIGALVPATWGIDAFVHLDSDGADLSILTTQYRNLWLLALLYTATAIILLRYNRHRIPR